ncbi:MAG: hypothetical protein IH991_08550, partial [Planctomycetes bacterium]|nr:hypothetical protein [Planctomycetota bacterium]
MRVEYEELCEAVRLCDVNRAAKTLAAKTRESSFTWRNNESFEVSQFDATADDQWSPLVNAVRLDVEYTPVAIDGHAACLL